MKNEATIDPKSSATHHWLQGYSAARLGKPAEPRDPAYEASYREGYRRGGN
jgi:hypothetical protein